MVHLYYFLFSQTFIDDYFFYDFFLYSKVPSDEEAVFVESVIVHPGLRNDNTYKHSTRVCGVIVSASARCCGGDGFNSRPKPRHN